MRFDELRNVHQAKPFRPFALHLSDVRAIRVDHSEFMALSPTGRTAVAFAPGGSFEIVDAMLITSVQVGNGVTRTRRKKQE